MVEHRPLAKLVAHLILCLGVAVVAFPVYLTFIAKRDTTVEEVNALMKTASEGALEGILTYQTEPLVSIDFNHDPRSSVFDSTQTRVGGGTLVKVLSWYDNEWGFSNRMLDTTLALINAR